MIFHNLPREELIWLIKNYSFNINNSSPCQKWPRCPSRPKTGRVNRKRAWVVRALRCATSVPMAAKVSLAALWVVQSSLPIKSVPSKLG